MSENGTVFGEVGDNPPRGRGLSARVGRNAPPTVKYWHFLGTRDARQIGYPTAELNHIAVKMREASFLQNHTDVMRVEIIEGGRGEVSG